MKLVAAALAAAAVLGSTIGGAATQRPVPQFRHVVLVVFENHAYGQVIGSREAPTFDALAQPVRASDAELRRRAPVAAELSRARLRVDLRHPQRLHRLLRLRPLDRGHDRGGGPELERIRGGAARGRLESALLAPLRDEALAVPVLPLDPLERGPPLARGAADTLRV